MKRNKFFSLSLMWEGIKQTKTVGICLAIMSLLSSCLIPVLRIISFLQMDSKTANYQSDITVTLQQFAGPIFVPFYIIPIILVFALFGFMNKRNASDFYHSVPLNRDCIYITYSAVVFAWCTAMILVNTLAAWMFYSLAPKVDPFTFAFIPYTMISSFILAILVASITLVAKGLSGTGFTNIIIALLIMFAPRVIILIFTQSITAATPIVNISSIPLLDIYCNILFIPFETTSNSAITTPMTLWYSAILAVIYFVIGFFIHRVRNSETAGTSSSFKVVQHIVRSALGILPMLVISVQFASRSDVDAVGFVITVVASLLIYFLYELATTRSTKKLLCAIPLYLIVVAFNLVFIFGSIGISNIIISDVPEISDIESVTVTENKKYWEFDNTKHYYQYKVNESRLTDKELINVLQGALIDNIDQIKSDRLRFYVYDEYESECLVTFHCSDGRDIERNIYINKEKYGNSQNKNQSEVSVLTPYLTRNNEYVKAITALPTDNEIIRMNSDTFDYDEHFEYIVSSNGFVMVEGVEELWKLFKEEYSTLTDEQKIQLNANINNFSEREVLGAFYIGGYIGTKEFDASYYIDAKYTPKTYSEMVNAAMNAWRDGINDKFLDNVAVDKDYSISMRSLCSDDSILEIMHRVMHKNENDEYRTIDGSFEDYSNINASLKKFNASYSEAVNKDDIDGIKKIAKILIDASENEFNISGNNPTKFIIETNEIKVMYANLSDEQYNEINNILKSNFTAKKYTEYVTE